MSAPDRDDAAVAVQRAMSMEHRARFLDAVCEKNPILRGAHVADVLSRFDSIGANPGFLESIDWGGVSGFDQALLAMAAQVVAEAPFEATDLAPTEQARRLARLARPWLDEIVEATRGRR